MINTIARYRRLFASLLAVWMSMIIISGIVFMHKEITSDGDIIIHVHPYDFTKKKSKHHKSDGEIRHLDVVFQGTFTEPDFLSLDFPILQTYAVAVYSDYFNTYHSTTPLHSYSRGPPTVA